MFCLTWASVLALLAKSRVYDKDNTSCVHDNPRTIESDLVGKVAACVGYLPSKPYNKKDFPYR